MKTTATYMMALFIIFAAGCKEMDFQPAQIARLGQTLQNYDSMDTVRRLRVLDSLHTQFTALALAMGQPQLSAEFIEDYSQSAAIRIFQPDVDKTFPTLTELEMELGHVTASAQSHGLSLPHIYYATVSWGKPQPLMRVGDVVLIALNHYLGSDYPGYSHWHEYLRHAKAREFIQYDVAAALAATQYPFSTQQTPTLLNWMLYEGALVEARMALCLDARLNLALGYTPAELEWAEDHTQELWKELILNKTVYTTDPDAIDRLLVSAPAAPLAQNHAPARIGRFIGYKILKEYKKKHRDKTLRFFLSPDFYDSNSTLPDSGF